jgi:hypothetical protein
MLVKIFIMSRYFFPISSTYNVSLLSSPLNSIKSLEFSISFRLVMKFIVIVSIHSKKFSLTLIKHFLVSYFQVLISCGLKLRSLSISAAYYLISSNSSISFEYLLSIYMRSCSSTKHLKHLYNFYWFE